MRINARHARMPYGVGDHRKFRPWRPVHSVVTIALLVIATALVGGMQAHADTMHRSERCEHETIGHVYYRQCESRQGDWVTYTFTRIVRVHV